MSGESKQDRRRFLRNAAVTIAAAELGTISFANGNPTTSPQGQRESRR
jgi:hypothetical protein